MFVNYVASENGSKPVLTVPLVEDHHDQSGASSPSSQFPSTSSASVPASIPASVSAASGAVDQEIKSVSDASYVPSMDTVSSVGPGGNSAGSHLVATAHDPLIKIETHKDVTKFKYQGKSRSGCITCKSRKKKCDENKPVCGDCARLKIECIWEHSNMTADEVRAIKEKLSSTIKLRKRKSATDLNSVASSTPIPHNHHNHNHSHSHSHSHGITKTNMTLLTKKLKSEVSGGSGLHTVFDASIKPDDASTRRGYRTTSDAIRTVPFISASASDTPVSSPMSQIPALSNQTATRISGAISPGSTGGSISSPHFGSSNMDLLYPMGGSPRLLNSYGIFNESSSRSTSAREMTPMSLDNNIRQDNIGFPLLNRPQRKEELLFRDILLNPTRRSDYDILQQNLSRLASVNTPTTQSLDSPNEGYSEQAPKLSQIQGTDHLEYNQQHHTQQQRQTQQSQPAQQPQQQQQQQQQQQHQQQSNVDFFRYLSDKSTPATPSAFWTLLKDLSSQKQHSNKIQFLDDEGNPIPGNGDGGLDSDSDHEPLSGEFEHNTQLQEMKALEEYLSLHTKQSGGGNAIDMLSVVSKEKDVDDLGMFESLIKNQQLADSFSNIFTPFPYHNIPLFDNLPKNSTYLYNYYVDVLSKRVSIAPVSQNESNSYQKVFLPLAHADKSVLFAILAWSSFHLGGEWIQEGNKFVELSLRNMVGSGDSINYTDEQIRKLDRNTVLHQFATLLILCGAEICRGDIRNWSEYLKWTSKLLRAQGGILNFNRTKEEHWLISNFAYHDVLASSSTVRGTYFPLETYELVFEDREGHTRGNLNPLLGISKNLYRIIGNISTLAYESTQHLRAYYERDLPADADEAESYSSIAGGTKLADDCDYSVSLEGDELDNQSDVSEHTRINSLLTGVLNRAKELEKEIDEAKPDSKDLVALTDEELELQLTLFESFQISTKLFLRQLIMKCNPSALELQILNNHLIKCIDILIGTPVMASLVFPVFIAGIHCVTQHDRKLMRNRVKAFIKLYGPWNIGRVLDVTERVWEQNPNGDNVVDWFAILKELKWDINFA